MKKYLILALVSTLALTSCGTKKDENKKEATTGTKTETSTTVKTGATESQKVETKTSTGSNTATASTWTADTTVKTTKSTEGITEKDGVSTFKNAERWYEISFKKADGLEGEVGFQNTEIFIADMKKWNSVSVLTEDYSIAPNITSLDKYFEESVKNLKNALKDQWVSEIKKENVTINGVKWLKATYSISLQGSKINFEQYFFENGKKLAYVVTKTVVWADDPRLTTVVNSFKLVK